ncbi:MAG: protein translocase subunit SecD [Clostridia bacterium]|nr:protein translocase subunit SecD [Clostridia bacterium]
MKAKNVVSFLLVLVLILAFAYVAAFDVKIGNIEIPSTFDKDKGIKQGLDLVGGSIIVFEPDVEDLSKVTSEEMGSAETVIRARLDSAGYAEATISRQGDTGLRVEIPNIDDPQQAVEMIGSTAKLEFLDADGKAIMDGSRDYVSGAVSKYGQVSSASGNQYYVELSFTKEGQAKFKEATQKAINATADNKNYISIALDGVVQMSPSVSEVIDSESCVITGGYDADGAQAVANLINSGQLPFSLKDAELRSVGPTLGSKALATSLKAALIGILLVMIFMLLVYRLPGLVADISLVTYVSLVTLIMAGFFFTDFRVTLTLPGIAGVILSIGMAVDANVVIFERIKEELRSGKSVGASVDAGFKRALTAVIDSNVTTIIASVVLYIFGTGTVKSFALTLFIGIVISMLTAVTLTKFLLRQIVGFNIKNPVLYGLSKRRDA